MGYNNTNKFMCIAALLYSHQYKMLPSGIDYSHTTATRRVPAYTGIYQMRCTYYKVAPDGLIQSETCRASKGK